MPSTDTFCGICDTPIYDEQGDNRQPCPQCMSLTRRLALSGHAVCIASATGQLTVTTYPQTLLVTTRDLMERGEYGIAIVVAHMACEVATERAFSESFDKQSIQHLEKPIFEFVSGYNLGRDAIRVLYTAFTGDEIQSQPFWPKFKASSTLRNHIMHKGAMASQLNAETSLAAADALVAYLKK